MLQEHFETISSFDDCPIFLRIYTPQKVSGAGHSLQGVVLLVHGFCEHSGRYGHVVERICSHNMACVALDIRGHGKSGFIYDKTKDGEAMIADVQFVLRYIQNKFGNHIPYKLLGHSLGGLLVTYVMAREQNPNISVFLSSPCYEIKIFIAPWKKFLARELSFPFPKFKIPTGEHGQHLSTNPVNSAQYMADPLCLKKIPLLLGYMVLSIVDEEKIKKAIEKIESPFTILAAEDDKLVCFNATKRLSAFYKNVKFYPIKKSGHETFNEVPEFQQQAFMHLENWLKN